MEENRLKVMRSNYDKKLFNQIYEDTKQLKKKLASEIDHRRFGIEYEDLLSWFDIKFIYVFNKYYELGPDILKGHLINALKTFKFRILRSSYQNKYKIEKDSVEIDNLENFLSYTPHKNTPNNNPLLSGVYDFMKKNLSEDAYLIFQIEQDPPALIRSKLENKKGKIKSYKITNQHLAEYLELDDSEYISTLRKEIVECIIKARENKDKISLISQLS